MARNPWEPGPRPDPPPAPPAKRPDFDRPGQGPAVQPTSGNPRRKCSYCMRWNEGTQCDGCGAAIDWSERRALPRLPQFPQNRVVK